MSIPKNYKALCLDFLYSYSELATINTNGELDKRIKNLSKSIIKIIPYKEISFLTKRELQIYREVFLKEEQIICTQCNNCTKPIALLRHLRNAIAHGNLNQNGNYLELKDWDSDNKNNITAIGMFEKTRVKRLLELFAQ